MAAGRVLPPPRAIHRTPARTAGQRHTRTDGGPAGRHRKSPSSTPAPRRFAEESKLVIAGSPEELHVLLEQLAADRDGPRPALPAAGFEAAAQLINRGSQAVQFNRNAERTRPPHASRPAQNAPRSRTPGPPPVPASAAPGHAPATAPRAGRAFPHRTGRYRKPPSIRPDTDTPLESRRPDALPTPSSPNQESPHSKPRTASGRAATRRLHPTTAARSLRHARATTNQLHRTETISAGQTRQTHTDQTRPRGRRPVRGRAYAWPPAGWANRVSRSLSRSDSPGPSSATRRPASGSAAT